jgi:spore coat polysaccharide biosynthesis protein SpsF
MKIGIVIQARLNSTRFPNKVLARLSTKTVIEEIINRAKQVQYRNVIVVATSDSVSDDKLVRYLAANTDIDTFRGNEEDVLSRYVSVAKSFQLDHVVRLTGDNPCIDAKVIDDTIEKHISNGDDYSCTVGYPLGMNIEVIASSALFAAAKVGKAKADIEHVTHYVRNNPQQFKLNFIYADLPREIEQLRLTFDTREDYLLLQILFDYLECENKYFTLGSIINLWQSKPYIFMINDSVYQKKVFKNRKLELEAAVELLQKQEMYSAAEIVKVNMNEK